MPQKKTILTEKQKLHPRNLHRSRYDFTMLIKVCPELEQFVHVNEYRNQTIDFADAGAVKMLNRAILKQFYNIQFWDIPNGYLCPPIPGRADYIHYLADLLGSDANKIPKGNKVVGLDVGVGANCVYPIIGHQSYGWHFVASDIDEKAIHSAQHIIDSNPTLSNTIHVRLQPNKDQIFNNLVQPNDRFDFTMCNPPFHASRAEARAGTQRKLTNLGLASKSKPVLNFGGQQTELWCAGGEKAFVTKMINESAAIATQCLWFTSLISKTVYPAKFVSSVTKDKSGGSKNNRHVAK